MIIKYNYHDIAIYGLLSLYLSLPSTVISETAYN